MPYIGNTAANRFVASKAASVFSGDGSTTAFTLDHAVGSDEDILVSVDGVIQEPSVAYSVSGTTLTFTAAPSSNSGNNIFVYYLFRTVGTVSHPSSNALTATNATLTGNLDVTGTTTLSTKLATTNLGAGAVLQVVQTQTTTPADSSSATFADTTLTANITPSSTSNKILVIVDHTNVQKTGSTQAGIKLFRDSTEIRESRYLGNTQDASRSHISVQILELDSPSSSSQITYKTQYNNEQASGTVSLQAGNQESTMTLMEISG